MQYNFEWAQKKAKINKSKHKVSFENSCTVFRDLRAITIFDENHDQEERWITIGIASNGVLLIVNHTFKRIEKELIIIRIISSRKVTKEEEKQYLEV